jgi:hypothetical protein
MNPVIAMIATSIATDPRWRSGRFDKNLWCIYLE